MRGLRLLLATALLAGAAPVIAQKAGEISGEVRLSADIAKRVQPGGTLFVYVRALPDDRGEPVAVVSIKSSSYPQRFTLRPGDQMVQGATPKPLTGSYRLYARHSPTGQPMANEGFLGSTKGRDEKGVRAGTEATVVIDRVLP